MPLNRPCPKTHPRTQLRLCLVYNWSYDSLNFLNFPIGAIINFSIFRINQLNFAINFPTSKMHFIALNRVVWRIKRKNLSNGLGWNEKSELNIRRFWMFSRIWGEGAKPIRGLTSKFYWCICPELITCFIFGDDRFRGLASAEGHILPFPIDFDGRPYNTHTIPCERVMGNDKIWPSAYAKHLSRSSPNLKHVITSFDAVLRKVVLYAG